jgi:hypothetical protein
MQTLKYLFLGFLSACTIHLLMNASCFDKNNPTSPTEPKSVDVAKINEGASKAEESFLLADTAKLAAILTPSSLEQYRDIFKSIIPEMKNFGELFKTRKLVAYTDNFAEYSFLLNNGKTYTVTFSRMDDDSWKLVRF